MSRKRVFLLWFLLFVLSAVLIGLPSWLAIRGLPYPNLDLLLFFYAMVPMMWLAVLADLAPRATRIEFHNEGFTIKKIAQRASRHSYTDILTYNERPNSSAFESLNELRVYLLTNWFLIRSNDFKDYDYLKDRFTQYGQSGIRPKVLTLAERRRFRWAISGFALMLIANIIFGYVAHNPVDKSPASLTALTARVDHVSEETTKGTFKGFTFRLQNWPEFEFYMSRSSYEADIRPLKLAIKLNHPITLLIRESDLRKKLLKTGSLTFGDKYSDYHHIGVFGVDQGDWVRIQSPQTIYEPTHTNPRQRLFLLSFLLLICWAGWVYVDRHKVFRAAI